DEVELDLGSARPLDETVAVGVLVAGVGQQRPRLGRVVAEAELVDDRLVDVPVPGREQAGGAGGLDDLAVDAGDDLVDVDGVGQRLAEGRVVHRLPGGVQHQPGGVGRQHVGRLGEVGLDLVAALDQGGDPGQEVVGQVDAALEDQPEGGVVVGVDDVHDVPGLGVGAGRGPAPPLVVLHPDHPVLAVGLVQIGAAADRLLVGAGGDVLLRAALPQVLGHDRPVVQVVAPLLVQGLGEGEAAGPLVGCFGLLQPAQRLWYGTDSNLPSSNVNTTSA